MSLGEYLRDVRESRGLSLRDVERLTEGKVSNAYVSQLETGKVASPSVIVLHRLAAVYAIDFGVLCRQACVGTEPPPAPPLCPTCGQIMRGRHA